MMKNKHPFALYFRKHGHYPRLRIDSGIQRLTVEFAPGYVRISTSPPMGGQIYITRSAWFQFLRKAIPLSRRWKPYGDWDVPKQEHEYFLAELQHLEELRAQKRARKRANAGSLDEADRRERQKARHARAVARAARKHRLPET